jgi:hypothetical protein
MTTLLLRGAAIAQFAIAILNLFLIRIMKWKPDLARAPLLIREVFHIHIRFISITLAIFAVLTWRFASDIAFAVNPVSVWLAAAIGISGRFARSCNGFTTARAIGAGTPCGPPFIGCCSSVMARWP